MPPEPPTPPAGPTILLLIERGVLPHIRGALDVFTADLASDGYAVLEDSVDHLVSPRAIRDILRSYYGSVALEGAFLIGDIPAAYFEAHTGDYSDPNAQEVYISLDATDMYYMDLDGRWVNVQASDFCADRPPSVADCTCDPPAQIFRGEYIVAMDEECDWDYSHVQDRAQYEVEIWVARIMAHNLSIPGRSESDIINDFFANDHAYRCGLVDVEDRVCVLDAINAEIIDHGMNFTGVVSSEIRRGLVSESSYIGLLEDSRGSEITYFLCHSGPQGHAFPEGTLDVDALLAMPKNNVLYLLNACSACRWDQYKMDAGSPNYLGGVYTFAKTHPNGDYGICAIGFTGVGGFNWLEYFTDALSDPAVCYGDAFVYWFNRNLQRIFSVWNYVILGDPTIRAGRY